MDNITHTLAGAALGEAGLKKLTGLGMAALMIGANLPDVDVFGLPFGENLAWRRGWTHGPLALAILPAILAALLLAFDRWQTRRGTRPADRPPVRIGGLLLLSYIGALSHPLLDLMNTYGIRCLMPFSEQWFYGDILFIMDPWLWVALGLGIWLSRRRQSSGGQRAGFPAAVALLAAIAYTGGMAIAGRAAEAYAAREFRAEGLGEPREVLASPVFADPFRRQIVVRTEASYGFGDMRWFPSYRMDLDPALVPDNMSHPAIRRAVEQDQAVSDFLYWSRYPFATVRSIAGGSEVVFGDARFGTRPDGGVFSVTAMVPDPTPAGIGQQTAKNISTSETRIGKENRNDY